jgi:hypothetical protein
VTIQEKSESDSSVPAPLLSSIKIFQISSADHIIVCGFSFMSINNIPLQKQLNVRAMSPLVFISSFRQGQYGLPSAIFNQFSNFEQWMKNRQHAS